MNKDTNKSSKTKTETKNSQRGKIEENASKFKFPFSPLKQFSPFKKENLNARNESFLNADESNDTDDSEMDLMFDDLDLFSEGFKDPSHPHYAYLMRLQKG